MCSSVAVDGSLVVVVSSCPIIITVSPEKWWLVPAGWSHTPHPASPRAPPRSIQHRDYPWSSLSHWSLAPRVAHSSAACRALLVRRCPAVLLRRCLATLLQPCHSAMRCARVCAAGNLASHFLPSRTEPRPTNPELFSFVNAGPLRLSARARRERSSQAGRHAAAQGARRGWCRPHGTS